MKTAIFFFTVCIISNINAQHYLTKVNVSGQRNCFCTLTYKDGKKYTWKVIKKDTLKIIHSTRLDSIEVKCDSLLLKRKMDAVKKKNMRVPLKRGEIHL